ncbi:homoprotocatechuate degradative operon transcriptional repressor, MarR family [Trichinella spiralis]|uniref:homoprotocatechuate degradative operon transcriptional repressor, MarR family n=1 Tax=Trichinella spiralis TaxID=6334 RepID=UPI0001EFB350|nr:homoprotocatechuate degradative operon transcriptional repressor, MarR family [Trichinella spiralis]
MRDVIVAELSAVLLLVLFCTGYSSVKITIKMKRTKQSTIYISSWPLPTENSVVSALSTAGVGVKRSRIDGCFLLFHNREMIIRRIKSVEHFQRFV